MATMGREVHYLQEYIMNRVGNGTNLRRMAGVDCLTAALAVLIRLLRVAAVIAGKQSVRERRIVAICLLVKLCKDQFQI